MKTKTTTSITFVKSALITVVVLLLGIAAWTFGLALQSDTTPLGDPYYMATILAPERAFGPWALMCIALVVIVLAKIIQWWHEHHSKL